MSLAKVSVGPSLCVDDSSYWTPWLDTRSRVLCPKNEWPNNHLSVRPRLRNDENVLRCNASSLPISPFTERDSFKPTHGGDRLQKTLDEMGCISSHLENKRGGRYEDDRSLDHFEDDRNDIALRLPELRELLGLLKESKGQASRGEGRGPGNVYLVGTGPGDPELLTLKALKLMQTADLVLYDRLVSTHILDLVHAGARLLYVGKTAGYHSRTQDEIHELLLRFAEAGATVVRLKGGDPLVFGRGGEEMDFLQQQGISVKVVPGITAASGIAAELGIPLTHRGAANSVRFLTGHSRKGGTDPLFIAESTGADADSTLVIYMGLSTLPALALKLMANGLPLETPAAAVERGTTAQQRMVFAELKDLASRVAEAELGSPTLIIIGKVVALSPFWLVGARNTSELKSEKDELISVRTNCFE